MRRRSSRVDPRHERGGLGPGTDTNAKSFFLMLKRALPAMIARGRGSVVATASISAVVGLPTQAAYAASKGAMLQLVAADRRGICGNGRAHQRGRPRLDHAHAHPRRLYLDGLDDPAEGAKAVKGAHPMGRWAEPEEVADAIAFRRVRKAACHRPDPADRRRLHGAVGFMPLGPAIAPSPAASGLPARASCSGNQALLWSTACGNIPR